MDLKERWLKDIDLYGDLAYLMWEMKHIGREYPNHLR